MKLIKLQAVIEKTTLSRSTIYVRMANNDFPKPVKLGDDARRAVWVDEEIDAWIQEQIDARDTE